MFLLFGLQPSGQALFFSLWQRQKRRKRDRMVVILLEKKSIKKFLLNMNGRMNETSYSVPRGCKRVGGGQGRGTQFKSPVISAMKVTWEDWHAWSHSAVPWFHSPISLQASMKTFHPTFLLNGAAGLKRPFVSRQQGDEEANMCHMDLRLISWLMQDTSQPKMKYI